MPPRQMSRVFTLGIGGLLMLALAPTASAVLATGGVITTNGEYIIHRFTNSGAFTVTRGGNVEALVVAGGGGGGNNYSGGGGSGIVIVRYVRITSRGTVFMIH